ncbi:MAG: peroxiredoxin [Bacteroidales bacterium]|nr:peroxiredoxin [Bacteroidales bacterium]
MKKGIILSMLLIASTSYSWSQKTDNEHIPLLGEMAPEFIAQTTTGRLNFPGDYEMKWKILFSHPADFTPVCSTEILELATMQDEFDKMNTKIMVLSTDGLSSHMAWVESLQKISYPGDKPVQIKFPLIADPDSKISRMYGMIHSYTSNTRDVRGVFIIDPSDRIAAIFFYPMNVGRNMDEIKRTLIALQTSEKFDILTPANWNPGQQVMINSPATQQESEKMAQKKEKNLTSLSWYMWFKTLPQGKL